MIRHIKLVRTGKCFQQWWKMKNIVTCSFHAKQFGTTNGKNVREPSSGGRRMENLPRRLEETLAGSLQNPILYQRMNQEKYDVEIDGNKVKVFCLLVEKRICWYHETSPVFLRLSYLAAVSGSGSPTIFLLPVNAPSRERFGDELPDLVVRSKLVRCVHYWWFTETSTLSSLK